jgi:uncharacterized DUF497 family protein
MDLTKIAGFEWDDGNSRKSADKHGVSSSEAEQIFINRPLIVAEDARHSLQEARFHALGKTGGNKLLQLTFTLRQDGTFIRIISARPMNRKERVIYERKGNEEGEKT